MKKKWIILKKIIESYFFFKKIFHYSYNNPTSITFAYIANFILAFLLLKALIWIFWGSLLDSEKDAIETITPIVMLLIINEIWKKSGRKNLFKKIRQNIYTSVWLFFICFFIVPIKTFIINYLSWLQKKTS